MASKSDGKPATYATREKAPLIAIVTLPGGGKRIIIKVCKKKAN